MKVRFRRELGKSGLIKKSTTFNLGVRAELSTEEQDLIRKCDAADMVLYRWMAGPKHDIEISITVKNVVEGRSVGCEDFVELLRTEDEVRKACGVFKQLLERARKFGEEEIVEF